MNRFRAKLTRAFGTGEDAKPPAPAAPATEDGDVLSALRRRVAKWGGTRLPATLPAGREHGNARGSFWLRELVLGLEERHGTRFLATGRAEGGDLFLDVETTGLAGGAGTVVFLTGLAFFRDSELVLEQAFLRSFAEEAAALHHVAERVAAATRLVTFVGKTFDRHRLAARFAIHKVANTILTIPHLDLYYVARRAHAGRLPDTKLRTVERALLGVERTDDLPGSEAPTAFLDWLRDRTGAIARVFEHNRLDVLSLVTLLGAFPPAELAALAAPARRRKVSGAGGGTSGAPCPPR